MNVLSGTGGLLIVAIGLNMMRLTQIRVGNLSPAVVYAVLIAKAFFG